MSDKLTVVKDANIASRFACSPDGRHIYDGDFGYDVRMDIDGDFPSDEERFLYTLAVCAALNDNPPPTKEIGRC